MIRLLKNHEIDFKKYKKCISWHTQDNWYAQKKVLDFWSENWELLVYNDYEAVLPLPLKAKYGFKFVSMPLFLQQLGIFGKVNDSNINEEFLTYLKARVNLLDYNFNCNNSFLSTSHFRKNYVIGKQSYGQLYKRYSKGRKSAVKSSSNLVFLQKEMDHEAENYILLHFKGLKNLHEKKEFVRFLWQFKSTLKLFSVMYKKQILSLAVVVETDTKFGLLALINNEKYKNKNPSSFLINEFLKQNISDKSLDFMGGNIRGIEVFFKSFGAEQSLYPIIRYSKSEFLKRLFVK